MEREFETMLMASMGINKATRNDSILAPVPNRRATNSSLATAASFASEVRMTIVVAARKTCRFVDPVVSLSQRSGRELRSLLIVALTGEWLLLLFINMRWGRYSQC